MNITVEGGLKYFTFPGFDQAGVKHAVFTRRGGVSLSPWDTLNTGGLSGDDRSNVIENRRRIFEAMHLPVESIFDVWQVHSSQVIYSERPRPLDAPHQKADAIITDKPGVTLFMRFGDCVPILYFDPVRQVIALAHAGWIGTISHIAGKTVKAMISQFGCDPRNIITGIGPSIGPDHYQVGPDVVAKVENAFDERDKVLTHKDGKYNLDLWKANSISLTQEGVSRIESSGICTACHTDDWFSHRAEHGKTGRFAALICLDK